MNFNEISLQSVISILISIAVILLALFLWNFGKKAFMKYAVNMGREKQTAVRVASGVVKYIVMGATTLIVLEINGINVSSVIAGLGIASAIVGLALQDILKDVIMGVNIITENFYSVGDVVEYKGTEGIVTNFSVRTTKIKSITDGSVTTICNRNISEIRKCSSMVDIDIPLSYNEDVRRVHEIMRRISSKISEVDGIDGSVYKGTERFDESGVIYKMRFFCLPENKPDMRRAAIKIIQDELDKEEIRIPYRQLDVHSI